MKASKFLNLFSNDSLVQHIHLAIKQNPLVQLEGLVGSIDSILVATNFLQNPSLQFILLQDKEEAAFFYDDLRQLLPENKVAFFPTSYKRPYQFELDEVENANVLLRAEVLNRLGETEPLLIVTYPEALAEKVVNRQSLVANTLTLRTGEQLDSTFITELLVSYGFEKVDFVYEPGQFAIRGGIIDIFSFANEYPIRIELFGKDIESLRFFDTDNQLSIRTIEQVSIIPDVQNKLQREGRESLLAYAKQLTTIWADDFASFTDKLSSIFTSIQQIYTETTQKSGDVNLLTKPEELFLSSDSFLSEIKPLHIVEFGRRYFFKRGERIGYKTLPQPSFNKDFELLSEDISAYAAKNYAVFICSDTPKQLERLTRIFEEINPALKFIPLELALREGFVDPHLQLVCYTDHQIFEKYHRYKLKERFSKSKALTIKELKTLQPGDYITHIDYGIGRFAGMESIEVNGKHQEVIRVVYKDNDLLYVNIHSLHKIAKYSGKEGIAPSMSKLGSGEWETRKSKVKKQVKDIAEELIKLYAKRRSAPGFAFSADSYMQAELESSFMYEDTPDQAKAAASVKEDMEKPYPMDRLVCGDVGFGKTEVAIRAAFKAAADSKQVAVLVPTTILAFQHFKTFSERLSKLPVKVDYINRFKSSRATSETLKALKEGKIDILIGTHSILSKNVEFKNLGLLIIDEEQKFGVKAKDKIKEMKLNVDVLTLTATPIPRTLHFSLLGARDLSVIATPPPNRYPVTTEIAEFREPLIRDVINYELQRGGQVFFVHNRVNDIDSIGNIILRLVPDARIGVAHGQMEGDKLEKVMLQFIEGDIDILISTNIIEAGLDIPNANTIIINQAHMFGLSDLHQMRGRVGRSNKKAYCYLLTQPISLLTKEARKRLKTLEEFSELGDGFRVAMRDLDIRGAGNMLGSEQSGFINDLGYEVYHKILDDAVKELRENEFKDLFMNDMSADAAYTPSTDCQIETDLAILIPDTFISNISERLATYNQIDNLKTPEELASFREGLQDRFGQLPLEVENLFEIVQIRWLAEIIGFEKLTIKHTILKGYFVSSQQNPYFQSDTFGKVLDFVRQNPTKVQLKQTKEKLIFIVNQAESIEKVKSLLTSLVQHIKRLLV